MNSYLANPTATRETLRRFGLATKHRLGQNFLVSDAVVGRTLELAELAGDDVVYEVGPGIGTLTVALLPRVSAVVAVEADATLVPVLRETCADAGGRLALVCGDAARIGPQELSRALAKATTPARATPTKLVANLPYQVAATVLLRTFEQLPSVRRAVVMVQAEVAGRIAARPGSRTYGAYTAKLALHGRLTGRFGVSAGNFMPPPHVGSAVVRIDRATMAHPMTGAPLAKEALERTKRVIDAAFAQRRKTLANSLAAAGLARDAIGEACAATGIDGRARAETLSPADFVRLADVLGRHERETGDAHVKTKAAQQHRD